MEGIYGLFAERRFSDALAVAKEAQHPTGKRIFSDLHEMMQDQSLLRKFSANSKLLVKTKRKMPDFVVQTLAQGLTAQEMKSVLGIPPRKVTALLQKIEVLQTGAPVSEQGFQPLDCSEPELQLYFQFFESKTDVFSGSRTLTRVLKMSHRDLFEELYVEYPERLRALARQITAGTVASTSRLGKHIAQAKMAQTSAAWSVAKEQDMRRKFIVAQNELQLEKQRNQAALTSKIMPTDKVRTSKEPPVTFLGDLIPVTAKTFWRYMNKLRVQKRLRWTENYKPYPCKIHDKGPMYELQLKDVERQIEERLHKQLDSSKALEAQLAQLHKKVRKYHVHLEQFATCRPMVEKLMADLKENECLLFRDFVNQHNILGSKINNLVFVVIEKSNEVLLRSKISNFCSDKESQSCDKDFVADVFEFHLAPQGDHGSGLFAKFDTIYISGPRSSLRVGRHYF